MMHSLAKRFNGLQEKYEKVLESKPIYIDDLDITLNDSKVSSTQLTKKSSRCLERAKRIDKALRFEEEEEEEEEIMTKPPVQKEGLKPRKVVRFQLENNKIFEPKEKPLDEKEGLVIVEEEEKVVRVKFKMTKQEAQRLLSKCGNDSVSDFEHVVNQISHVPAHKLQVAVVVVACNNTLS
ncbi:unnamed protein product [Cochlearia groenlandica]